MSKFGISDIIDVRRRPAEKGKGKGFQEIWLSPYDVVPSEDNFYSQENIEELADSFLAVGQQQPTVLARTGGRFVIVSGHRRNLANIMNFKRGHKEYEKVRYLYRDMTDAMLQLSLLMGNACNRELTAWEKTQQAQRLKEALLKARKEDGLEITGKLRDVIANLMHESSSNIAKMESISKNATPEIKEEFKKGNLGITAAYEVTKLGPETQKIVAGKIADGESVPVKEIKMKVFEMNTLQEKDTKKAEKLSPHMKKLQEWSKEETEISKAAQIIAETMDKVFETNTSKAHWTDIDWTVFFSKGIMHYADCVNEEDLYLLHDIMAHCQIRFKKTKNSNKEIRK